MKILKLISIFMLIGVFGITAYSDSGHMHENADMHEHEETISMDDLPDAVVATIIVEILREADDLCELENLCGVDGLEIEEIERECEDGKMVYHVEIEYKCKDIELKISADGKLLKKKVELDDDDEDDEMDKQGNM